MAESFALSNLLSRYPREAEAIARELGVRPFVPLEDERVSALVDERLRLAESPHPPRRLPPPDPRSLFEVSSRFGRPFPRSPPSIPTGPGLVFALRMAAPSL